MGTRKSRHIQRKPASNLQHAIRIAEAKGRPLNHFVTVNFSLAGCPDEEVSDRFRLVVLARFSDWVRRPSRRSGLSGVKPTHVWVIEGAGGVLTAHWLLHLPEGRELDFLTRLSGWVERATGCNDFPSNTIDAKVSRTPRSLGQYLLKGMDPMYAPFYNVDWEDQGIICGKRSGYSQDLGPSEKRRMRKCGEYAKAKPFMRFSEQQARARWAREHSV